MPTEAATCRKFVVPRFLAAGWDDEPYSIPFRRDVHPEPGADYVLAKPPFPESDTAPRRSVTLQPKTDPQVMREAKDNFRNNDHVRWQYGPGKQLRNKAASI
jgi:hypothetical protein